MISRCEGRNPSGGRARDQGSRAKCVSQTVVGRCSVAAGVVRSFLLFMRISKGCWAYGQDIAEWAVPNDADYIALSFVQTLDLILFWTMLLTMLV